MKSAAPKVSATRGICEEVRVELLNGYRYAVGSAVLIECQEGHHEIAIVLVGVLWERKRANLFPRHQLLKSRGGDAV